VESTGTALSNSLARTEAPIYHIDITYSRDGWLFGWPSFVECIGELCLVNTTLNVCRGIPFKHELRLSCCRLTEGAIPFEGATPCPFTLVDSSAAPDAARPG
jgi:hypothetical protein